MTRLSDPVRLRLLSLVGAHAGGEACVCELVERFDLSQPTISHHLKLLREAGLITSGRRGTWVYYRALPGVLEELARPVHPSRTEGLLTPIGQTTRAWIAANAAIRNPPTLSSPARRPLGRTDLPN